MTVFPRFALSVLPALALTVAWPTATWIDVPVAAAAPADDFCRVGSGGAKVEVVRPSPGEPAVDDVNWFARPVPNPRGHWIVGFASHNLNYLYDLTAGRRIRVPDKSDAVATPDGRYLTVPSHYTSANTVNFYDLPTLLARLDKGQDAADVPPVFAHADPNVHDVYYQSVGVVSHDAREGAETTVYRMMFSGSRQPPPPGFRVIDYTFTRANGRVTVTPSPAMRLCPQIVEDMATPFISKDGRYVVSHDKPAGQPASLKIFEITGLDPAGQTTTCHQAVDFGFAAGKADFSFDGSKLTFHVATYDYLTAFIDGGLKAPIMTDVVVADLDRDAGGAIVGYKHMARVTTTTTPGTGRYFPAFMPDGKLFYLASEVPKSSVEPKRFTLNVVDPSRDLYRANLLANDDTRRQATAIGELWRSACAPELPAFKPHEAAWYFLSLAPAQCRALVDEHGASPAEKAAMGAFCEARTTR